MMVSPETKDWFESPAQARIFEDQEYACVYLLGPPKGRPLRLGASRCPGDRIKVLQDAHWQPLSLHAILWLGGSPLARRLEREAARLLSSRSLTHHWYDVTPDLAMSALDLAARNLNLPVMTHAAMLESIRSLHAKRINRALALA